MPQYLAIDWSPREVRFVLADGKGPALQVEAAGAMPIAARESGTPLTPDAIGTALREALAPHKVGKMKALVSIGRGSVELHRLSLPPASDAELPILVANQISREFSTATEASIVDFVADTAIPNQPRQVTAAVLSSQQHANVCAVCTAAGLVPHRIVLRPYATATLYSMSSASKPATCLLINIVEDEVDLTIVRDAKATFSRTVRFPQPAGEGGNDEWLYAELTRTLLAAPRTSGEVGPVAGVCLFGSAGDHGKLRELVEANLKIPVETIEPFAAVGASATVQNDPGRFASLVGMVAAEAGTGSHEIDFVNPRRPPVPKNRRRPLTIAAGLAALTVVAFGYTIWDEFSEADAKISELKQELKTLNTQIKKAGEKQVVVEAVEEWRAGDVAWLDELRDLSDKLPGSRDLTVMRMSMSPARGGGGVVTLQGAARSWTVVERMATTLRDEFHEVGVPHQQGRNQDEARGWHFDTSIAVAKRNKEQYLGTEAAEGEVAEAKTQNEAAETGKKQASNAADSKRTQRQAAN